MLEGEFDFFVGDRVVRRGPGAFVSGPPGVVHDFRNPGAGPARWLGIVSPGKLERYFDEVRFLVERGALSEAAQRDLRARCDTEEPDQAPAGHWSHAG